MKYDLRDVDFRVIEAAIRLGDWLATQPQATDEQVTVIRYLQEALRRLPEDSPGVDAEYGFHVVPEQCLDEHSVRRGQPGIERSWIVTLYPPGILEIFSCYTPFPETDLLAGVEHELFLYVEAGKPNLKESSFYYDEWIKEVSNPAAFKGEGIKFNIEASIGPEDQLRSVGRPRPTA